MTFKEKTKEIVSDKSFSLLEKYVYLIEEKNKVMNLTGFTGDRLWEEGIFESIVSLTKGFKECSNKKMLDIGAGAGFPSVPFAIANPSIELTIYEPLNKRVLFLEEVIKTLELKNITIKKERCELSSQKNYFDLITARAVAHIGILIEISMHVGKVGSTFCFIKGPSIKKELHESRRVISKSNIEISVKKLDDIYKKDIYLVIYKKTTDKLGCPRSWATIKKLYN